MSAANPKNKPSSNQQLHFQILSDLHLESPASIKFHLIPTAPYLLLLGDIHNTHSHPPNQLLSFLRTQILQFEKVFFVIGNHEPYHSSWPAAKTVLKEFANSVNIEEEKFIILDQTRYDFPNSDITILGCTLFSHIPPEERHRISRRIQDFDGTIENWSLDAHNAAHASDLAWLNRQVTTIAAMEPARRVIILTHHCPTNDSRAEDPLFKESSIKNAFQTDLEGEVCWRSGVVRVWGWGHTHFNFDFCVDRPREDGNEEVGKLRVLGNQRGWRADDEVGFNGGKVLVV